MALLTGRIDRYILRQFILTFFFGLLALIGYGLFLVLEPFLVPIAWAILLAFLAHPAQSKLNRLVRNDGAGAPSPAQVAANSKAAGWELTAADIAAIDAIAPVTG